MAQPGTGSTRFETDADNQSKGGIAGEEEPVGGDPEAVQNIPGKEFCDQPLDRLDTAGHEGRDADVSRLGDGALDSDAESEAAKMDVGLR